MKTYAICPISDKRINETVARSNAALTVLLLILFALSGNVIILISLWIDFLLRSSELSKYSPLSNISKQIIKLLGLKSKLINAGPKIFAARIGVFFTTVILFSSLTGLNVIALSFSTVLGICALLEAAWGFCVACQIYPFVYKLYFQSKLVDNK